MTNQINFSKDINLQSVAFKMSAVGRKVNQELIRGLLTEDRELATGHLSDTNPRY